MVTDGQTVQGWTASASPSQDDFWDAGVTFDSLVEARFDAVQAKWGNAPPEHVAQLEQRYRSKRVAFEISHGAILFEYWTNSTPGGVALTLHRRAGLGRRLVRSGGRTHFHRFTDYLTGRFGDASELLYAGDALAAICEEVLRGPTRRIALTQIFTAASQLLSTLDASMIPDYESAHVEPATSSPDGSPEERKRWQQESEKRRLRQEEARRQREEEKEQRISHAQDGYRRALARAERFYRSGAGQAAQFYYFAGMLFGGILVGLLAFAVTLLVPALASHWHLPLADAETAAGFAATTAGALGASVSVMWRMTAGTFGEEAVFGSDNLARLGTFRPFLGGTFGFILYVALKADLISQTYVPANPGWYFYIFVGFLAGFSERLVPDFLGDSAKAVAPRTPMNADSVVTGISDAEGHPQAPVITA